MGYRSEVYIKAENRHTVPILTALKKAKLLDIAHIEQDETYLYISMMDLKWYHDYKDVELVNSTIEKLPDNEAALLAIGEDSEISCEINEPWELELSTYRTIDGMDAYGSDVKTRDELVKELQEKHPEYFI